MQTLIQDLRYGARMLLKNPGFSLIAVLTLAIGIGANTAIFTVVDAALLRALPYQSPERLFHVWERTPQQQEFTQREFSYPDYQDYQQNNVFDGLAAYTGGSVLLTGRGEATRIISPRASANFFSLLGVKPLLGRTFEAGEDKPGTARVAVLTYGLWQRRFGGDPNIVGQTLALDDGNCTVVGVLPASFHFALQPGEMWLAYQPNERQLTRRYLHGTRLIGRLRSGVSVEQAKADLGIIANRIAAEYKDSHAGTIVTLLPLQEQITGSIKPLLLALTGAVGLVLLMVCANVASLLLSRSLSRQKEIAVRTALGATGKRIIRQLLTEAALLSLLGGIGGVLIAYWSLDALVTLFPDNQRNFMPFLQSLHLDAGVLMFALGISLMTGIVFGLAPAMQTARVDLHEALKEGARTSSSAARQRLRSGLVVTEIALAVVLLVGAGLMLKSLWRLMQTNLGFDPQHVLTLTLVLPPSKYAEPNRILNFYEQLQTRVAMLPGVTKVGIVDRLPLLPGNTTRFIVDGDPVPAPGQETEAYYRVANADYFTALGIPLIKGRLFNANDQGNGQNVAIINKTTADKLFGTRDPLGRRLVSAGGQQPGAEIIGVVGDVKVAGLDQAIQPTYYESLSRNAPVGISLVVRTGSDPQALSNTIRNECQALEPNLVIINLQTMEELLRNTPAVFLRRFPSVLIGIFSFVALLLASLGIYGVVSYAVSQQTRAIGIRMALGARAADVLKMVLKQGLTLALIGIAIGVIAALILLRLMRGLLYEVNSTDPVTFVAVIGALLLVAILACFVPARRATKVDPMIALRCE